jgi:hypothetical protein
MQAGRSFSVLTRRKASETGPDTGLLLCLSSEACTGIETRSVSEETPRNRLAHASGYVVKSPQLQKVKGPGTGHAREQVLNERYDFTLGFHFGQCRPILLVVSPDHLFSVLKDDYNKS